MASKLFKKALNNVPKDTKIFVGKSMDIVERLGKIISEKGISQRELAKQLKKSPSEINKWLTGSHNFTLKTISKLEAILDTDLVVVPQSVIQEIEHPTTFAIRMVIKISHEEKWSKNLVESNNMEVLPLSEVKVKNPYYLRANKINAMPIKVF